MWAGLPHHHNNAMPSFYIGARPDGIRTTAFRENPHRCYFGSLFLHNPKLISMPKVDHSANFLSDIFSSGIGALLTTLYIIKNNMSRIHPRYLHSDNYHTRQ
jgi:hypothetical protein